MITDRESKRLDKIRKQIASRVKVSREDAQWALDLARREGAILRPTTIITAMAQGYNVAGIKSRE